jgi:hypothetical protein
MAALIAIVIGGILFEVGRERFRGAPAEPPERADGSQ